MKYSGLLNHCLSFRRLLCGLFDAIVSSQETRFQSLTLASKILLSNAFLY